MTDLDPLFTINLSLLSLNTRTNRYRYQEINIRCAQVSLNNAHGSTMTIERGHFVTVLTRVCRHTYSNLPQ